MAKNNEGLLSAAERKEFAALADDAHKISMENARTLLAERRRVGSTFFRRKTLPFRSAPSSPLEVVAQADREFVNLRAGERCEYCHAPQVITATTCHVEHIVPRSRGGADSRANYALSCITCNGDKADYITGIDPHTGLDRPLFHPRRDKWDRHFRYEPATREIRGTTAMGRATVARLQMNEPKQIAARELLVDLGIYP